MTFETFINSIPNIVLEKLTGNESHKKFTTVNRIEALNNKTINNDKARQAAVMILLYPKNNITHLVLIIRNSYEGIHSSQIAFPGGKAETFDTSLFNTALRETHEEIGILPEKVKLVKALTPLYIPPSNFMVHPFLGYCEETIAIISNEREVSGILEVPLKLLYEEEIIGLQKISNSYMKNTEVPAFSIQGQIVWGATAMMLNELKDVIKNAQKG